MVNVPRLKDFKTEVLYEHAMRDPEVRLYLPDASKHDERTVSRKFLYNVSAGGWIEYWSSDLIIYVDHFNIETRVLWGADYDCSPEAQAVELPRNWAVHWSWPTDIVAHQLEQPLDEM